MLLCNIELKTYYKFFEYHEIIKKRQTAMNII